MSVDLVNRIKAVNTASEKVNRQSVEAQAKRKLLLEQISEKVSSFEEEYGISFPSIENTEEFNKFLENLLNKVEKNLEEQVSKAEEVNKLINSGNIEKAQQLLGYKPKEVLPLNDEKVVENTENLEEVEEVKYSNSSKGKSKEEVSESGNTDDLEEDVPVSRPRPRRRSAKVETTDFDMNLSLNDLDDVAEEVTPETQVSQDLEEEEEPLRPIRRRRRTVILDEDDEDEVEEEISPIRTKPVKTGGSFSWDD